LKFKLKRSYLISALILIQVVLLFFAVWNLSHRAEYLYTITEALNIVAVIIIIYNRQNPAYKLTWVALILIVPLFGILIYFIAGTQYLSLKVKKRLEHSQNFNKELRVQKLEVLGELKKDSEIYFRQVKYILNTDKKPVYKGTNAKLLTPGEKMFEVFLEELKKAEEFILLEYFVISSGQMWDSIYDILKQKAKDGIEVKLIYDDMGSIDYVKKNFHNELESFGIRVCIFNPFMPVISKFMNYRDHRKIAIVDGNVAFTGGFNIGDEYINVTHPHGNWKDVGIMLTGDAVWSFIIMFLDMWQIITGEKLNFERYRTTSTCIDDGFFLPFDDNPVNKVNIAESVYMQLINNAKQYIYITTPYLILDNEMASMLCIAARSGVDVRIITPHIADKWFVHMLTRSNYQRLLENGVKIYEYTPGFIHAKTLVCDNEVGIIGTVNMDYRSFYLQFECAVWIYKSSILSDIKEDFMATIDISERIDKEKWNKRNKFIKIAEMLLNLFAPMM
jgi:cardiolipin synthase